MPFHERPLVVFTSLAIAGAGILAAHGLVWPVTGSPASLRAPDLALAVALLASGLGASTAHLGRTSRAPLAVRRAGRSPLATEVLLGGLLVGLGTLALVDRFAGLLPVRLDWPTVATASFFLVSVGLVYRLPGQVAWGPEVVPSPLATGLVAGTTWLAATSFAGRRLLPTLGVAIAVDLVLLAPRWWRVRAAPSKARPTCPGAFAYRHALLGGRLLALDVVGPAFVAMGAPAAAIVTTASGLILDRLGFYALAVRETVEGEIEQVEERIARLGPSL